MDPLNMNNMDNVNNMNNLNNNIYMPGATGAAKDKRSHTYRVFSVNDPSASPSSTKLISVRGRVCPLDTI